MLRKNEFKVLSTLIQSDKYSLFISKIVKIKLGSLYNILARLERKGLVKNYYGEDTFERGGNRRKYYQITALGSSVVTEVQKNQD